MDQTIYKKHPSVCTIKYSQRLLWKYHEISREIHMATISSLQNRFPNIDIQHSSEEDIKDEEIVQYSYIRYYPEKEQVEPMEVSERFFFEDFVKAHSLHYTTLLYILHKFAETHYYLPNNLDNDGEDKSDEEQQSQLDAGFAYSHAMLESLRNLLLMRESPENVEIVFNIRDPESKRIQSDYQVRIKDNFDSKILINNRIEVVMDLIRGNLVPNVPEYKFAGYTHEDLTSEYVTEIARGMGFRFKEDKGNPKVKESNVGRIFKKLAAGIVLDYLNDEGLMDFFQNVDDKMSRNYKRDGLYLTYQLLATLGLIDVNTVAKHTTRESRVKYMESCYNIK